MPNPGKPAEIKRMIGSRNYNGEPGSSVAIYPAISAIPEPPRPLSDSGIELWNRTWSMGQLWLLKDSDIHLLAITCEMLDERDLLRAHVMLNLDAWHERAGLRELEKMIIKNLSLLGFTPTDRMKLGVAEVKKQSKLEDLLARKAAK
jgi:phage terminase small subunit